jgi:hypothetical protein
MDLMDREQLRSGTGASPRRESGMSTTGKVAHGMSKAGAFVGGVGELGLPGGEALGALLKGGAVLLSHHDQPPYWPGSAPTLHHLPTDLLPPVFVGLCRRLEELQRAQTAATRDRQLFVDFGARSEKERYAMQKQLYRVQRELFPKQPRPDDPSWPRWGMPPTVAAARGYWKERDSRAGGWILRGREQVAGRTSGDAKAADVAKVLQSVEDAAVVAELLQRWALEREDVQIHPKLRKACREIGEQQRVAGGSRDELDQVCARVLDLLDKMNGRRQTVYPEKERHHKETLTSAPLVGFMRLLLCSGDDIHGLCARFAATLLPPEMASSQVVDRVFVRVGAATELQGGHLDDEGTPVYVNCYLDDGPKQQTQHVEDDLNPNFDDEFVFFLTGDPLSELRFKLQKKAATKGLNDEFVGEVKVTVADLLDRTHGQGMWCQYPLGDPHGKLSKRMKKHVERRSVDGSDDPFGRISLAFRFDSSSNGHRVELMDTADATPQAVSRWEFRVIGAANVTADQPSATVGGAETFECRWEEAKRAHSSMLKLFPWLSQIDFPSSSLADRAIDVAADDTPPKGFVSRARRRSVAVVMGSAVMPNAAQLASMATHSESDTTTEPLLQHSSHARRGQDLLKYFTQVFMHLPQDDKSFIFLARFRDELGMEAVQPSSTVASQELEGEGGDDENEESHGESESQPRLELQMSAEALDVETVDAEHPLVQQSSSSRVVTRATYYDLLEQCPDSSAWSVEENFCLALMRACQPSAPPQEFALHCPYVCVAKRGIALHGQPDKVDDISCDDPREAAIHMQLTKQAVKLDKKASDGYIHTLRAMKTAKLCDDIGVHFVQCGEKVTIDQVEMPFGPDSTIRMRCTRRNGQSGWATLYGKAPVERIIDGISTETNDTIVKSLARRFVAIPDAPRVGHHYQLRYECNNYAVSDASRRNDLKTVDGNPRAALKAGFDFTALAVEETSNSRLLGVVRIKTNRDEFDGRWVDLLHCDTGEVVMTPAPSEDVPPASLRAAGVAVLATTRVRAEETTSALEVDAWLASCSLGRYAEAIKAEDYDALNFFRAASEEDIMELATAVAMKKPHQNAFRKAWQELVAVTDDATAEKQPAGVHDRAPDHSESQSESTEPELEPEPEPEPELEPELHSQPRPQPASELSPTLQAFFDSESSSDSEDWGVMATEPTDDAPPPLPASRPRLFSPTPAVARVPPLPQTSSISTPTEAVSSSSSSVVAVSNAPESLDAAAHRLRQDLARMQDRLVVTLRAAVALVDVRGESEDGCRPGVDRAERLTCGPVQDLVESLASQLVSIGGGASAASSYVDTVLQKTERLLASFEKFVSTKCSEDERLLQEIIALEFELDCLEMGELFSDSDENHDDV